MARLESLLTRLYDPLLEPLLGSARAMTAAQIASVAPTLVLDVCSGTGTQVRALRDAGYDAFGADLTLEMVSQARGRLPPDAMPLQNAKALAFRDGTFDLVLASFALHEKHEPTARAMVSEMARVARPGGHVLLVDYAVDGDRTRLGRAVTFGVEWLVGGNHYRNYRTFMGRGGLPWLTDGQPLALVERRAVAGGSVEGRLYRRV